MNIFSIAGSKSHAVAEVLAATIIENRAANKILQYTYSCTLDIVF